jgi:hypothetical protein
LLQIVLELYDVKQIMVSVIGATHPMRLRAAQQAL